MNSINNINNDVNMRIIPFGSCYVRCIYYQDRTWYVFNDVCDVLNLYHPSQYFMRIPADEKANITVITGRTNKRVKANVVTLKGFIFLLVRANTPFAKEFQAWLLNRVLPAAMGDEDSFASVLAKFANKELEINDYIFDFELAKE